MRIGPEAGFDGNDDVRVREIGGVLEIGSLAFRAGRANIRYAGGIEESSPYYSVGYVTRFGP